MSPRLAFALLLGLGALASPAAAPAPRAAVGSFARDDTGRLVAEHRIAGLRVVEVLAGGARRFDESLPVVLAIHGRGDRVRLPASDLERLHTPMRVLLPEAPTAYGEGFTWSPVSVTEGREAELADALAENAARLAEVLDWVRTARPRVGEPIVTGFSQGGMLAFTLASQYPHLVGTAVPVAGFLPRPLTPTAQGADAPNIRAVHGVDDPIVRVAAARTTVDALRGLGFSATLVEVPGTRHAATVQLKRAVDAALAGALRRANDRASRTSASRRSRAPAR